MHVILPATDEARRERIKNALYHQMPPLTVDDQRWLYQHAFGEEIRSRKRCELCGDDGVVDGVPCDGCTKPLPQQDATEHDKASSPPTSGPLLNVDYRNLLTVGNLIEHLVMFPRHAPIEMNVYAANSEDYIPVVRCTTEIHDAMLFSCGNVSVFITGSLDRESEPMTCLSALLEVIENPKSVREMSRLLHHDVKADRIAHAKRLLERVGH